MNRKFLSNLLLIILLNLLVKPIAIFGIDAAVQNRVGAEEYGLFFSLLNFTFLFNILLDLGINNFTTKNVAQFPEIVPKYFGKVMTIRFLLFIVYTVFSLTLGLVIGYDERAFSMLGFLILNQFFITLIAYIRSHFSGLLFFKTDAFISVLDRILLIIFCGMLLFGPWKADNFQIEWFVWILTGCYGITFLIALLLLFQKIGIPKIKFQKQFSWAIMRQSLPFALLILLMMIYTRTDSVMIERLHENGEYESGVYAQGFRLLDAFFMFGMIFTNLLFPLFSKMLKQKEEVSKLLQTSSKMLIWGAIALAILCFWNGEFILKLIYSSAIEDSILPFQLLMFTFIGMCITLIYGTFLTANGNLKFLNAISAIGLVVNIVLNLFLIPEFGAVGAAFATLITQLMVGIIQWFYVRQLVQQPLAFRKALELILFTGCLMGLGYLATYSDVHFLFQCLMVALLFFLFKVIHLKELRGLLRRE